ncbi:MAG: NRDE family protein [Desulfatitalea sp.]|nr:NRDE family protein [Desulfatitalea sp.]NNK02283.1 NRDE family protein [Desulfatitalea sp.]
MCLILFAYDTHPHLRLVLAANRDEYYRRPTAPADFWPDCPHILAGRDLAHYGTWMGVTRSGRLAAITNYRAPSTLKTNAPSRGRLVSDFLAGDTPPDAYLRQIASMADQYNGFNLIIGDPEDLFYYSNQSRNIMQLSPGVYGLSNHLLDTPWPKVAKGKQRLRQLLSDGTPPVPEPFFHLMRDQTVPPDAQLPDTGVGLPLERLLGSVFIKSPGYGTRNTTLLFWEKHDRLDFYEQTWETASAAPQPGELRHFRLDICGQS